MTGFFILAAASMLQASPQSATPRIDRVAWLQGCWISESPQRTIEENWMAPRGGSMIGVARTTRDGTLVEYKLVVLREQKGQLEYEAHPSGQATTVFLSTVLDDSRVVFENPQHDFPQRIGYERKGPEAVLAWIEGNTGGKPRRIEFSYRRTRCPGL
jgi:hypothetical protein